MKIVKAMVRGRVQGVGYRYFVKSHADRAGLKGYARNLDDGRVEVLVQGDPASIDALLDQLRIGPRYSRVDGVEAGEVSDTPFHIKFEIL